jgi:general secretion pathway protein F
LSCFHNQCFMVYWSTVTAANASRQSPPSLTRALIALSDFLRGAWPYLVAAVIGGLAAARTAPHRDTPRRRWHVLLPRMPWLRPLIRGVNTWRFASTLAILVGGGVPRCSPRLLPVRG